MINIDPKPPAAPPTVDYDAPCPACGQLVPWRSQIGSAHSPYNSGPTSVTIAFCLCPTVLNQSPSPWRSQHEAQR